MPLLPPHIETTADLRQLYRAAEARAARMRLLSTAGRELAEADPGSIAATLDRCAERLAFFVGCRSARLELGGAGEGIAIRAPGASGEPIGWLAIDGLASAEAIADDEDRETFRIYLDMIGATIDRIAREAERAQLLAALTDREKRLERLVGRVFSAQEEERRRVSQELHDGVAQTATALARMLEGANGSATDIPAADRARLSGIARDLVTELRAVIGGLRPTLLDDLGLVPALHALAEGLAAEGYSVTCNLEEDAARLPSHVETAVFRVAQEAIANVRKHAGGPCPVLIALRRDGENGGVSLSICDAGRGLDGTRDIPAAPPGAHVGIDVMKERMAAIGGALHWSTGPEGGVTVIARLPETL